MTETNSDGDKVRTFVHAGGAVVAWQTDGTYMGELVNWMHQEPGGASSRSTDSTGAIVISELYGAGAEPGELDPVGADSGLTNPYTDPDIPPDDGTGSSSQSSTAFGAPWHQRAAFSVDGIRVEPEVFFQVAAMSMQSPFNMLFYSIAVRRLDFFGHNTLTTWDPPAVDPNQLPPGGEEAGPNDIVNVNITLFRRDVNVNWVLTAFVNGQQGPTPTQQALPSTPEGLASKTARSLQKGGICGNFIRDLINVAHHAVSGNAPVNPRQTDINEGLDLYDKQLIAGNVILSGHSGVSPDGKHINYGVTHSDGSVEWNSEFYGPNYKAMDRAVATIHEALHQITGFTDQVLANAAQQIILGQGRVVHYDSTPAGTSAASDAFQTLLKTRCGPAPPTGNTTTYH